MKTQNLADKNFEILLNLFPNAVTETINENGEVVRAIDADVLRQEISCSVVEGKDERYQFTWPDKKNAILTSNAPVIATLRPYREESVDFDNTENIYIEGDNLDVLKLLQETYLEKIKLIYIDPPYNTGNDFIYEDDFAVSMDDYLPRSYQYDIDGNRLVQNPESNGRYHTNWLNSIYPRLRLAKTLLSQDGVIFISIDDNEVDNLKKICDEIFGESNHQATISYVRKTSGKQDSTNFMKSTEFILVYSKSSLWDCKPLIAEDKVTDRYNKSDEDGRKYRETDLRKTGSGDRREDRPLMWYPFYFNPSTGELLVEKEKTQTHCENGFVEIWPMKPDGTEGRWRWGYSTATENISFLVAQIMPKYKAEKKYTIYEKDYIDKNGEIRTVKEHTSWDRKEFNSDNAMQEFKNLGFSNQLFPFPKSSALIKHIAYLADTEGCIVLDFYSGSGTTAQSIMNLNAEDNGKRKYILVQLPETAEEGSEAYKNGYKNVCEIGKERIRRSAIEIKKRNPNVDTGFRVLKIDSSNMKDVYYNPEEMQQSLFDILTDNIKEDRTPEDLLFQVMLDLGVLLSSKIEETEIAGKKVFNVAEGFLIACFDSNVTEETVKAVAEQKPYYAVFRDSSMADDSVATNFDQIFEAISPETVRKVL